jgi:hypothetical protein
MKKLTLNKTTIAQLGEEELKSINGGWSLLPVCISDNDASCVPDSCSCGATVTSCPGNTLNVCPLSGGN